MTNTFLIGAAKAATSSMAHWLSQHQDVFLINGKESNYWRRDYYRGEQWYYDSCHQGYAGEKIVLDASTINQVLHYSPSRIAQLCPDPKIILCVRDPIDRAYAHWRMLASWRPGRVHEKFSDAILHNMKNFSEDKFSLEGDFVPFLEPKGECYLPSLIEQGLYGHNISYYLRKFRQQRIHLVDYDEIVAHPEKVWAETCRFLEISHRTIPLVPHEPNTKLSYKIHYYEELDVNLLCALIGLYTKDLQELDIHFDKDYAGKFVNKWSKRI